MKITADTNVLVRALVQDDPEQAKSASALLEQAELMAVPLPVLCELVWVLRRVTCPFRVTVRDRDRLRLCVGGSTIAMGSFDLNCKAFFPC